jgi:hypothetical protein
MHLNKLKKISFCKFLIYFAIENNIFGMEQKQLKNDANIELKGIGILNKNNNGEFEIKYNEKEIKKQVNIYIFEEIFERKYYNKLNCLKKNFFKGMTNKEIKKFLRMNNVTGVNGFYSDNILTCVRIIQKPIEKLYSSKIVPEELLVEGISDISNLVEPEIMKLSRILSQYANGKMRKGKKKAQEKYEQYIEKLKNENNYQNNQEQNNNNNNFQQNQQIEKK